ncbi:MAG: hypothetical protein NTY38_13660 [Acidobacteria bacterium]|nr:hypothetical protein [Acidobacteriota bacterium]
MSKTDFLEDSLLNHVLRNTAYTPAATVYVGLFTATPGEAGGGTEVTGNNYARKAVTFGAPSAGTITNSADVVFDQASGSWGTISYFALFDALANGNMLYYGALTSSKTINSGDQLKFAAGGITVTED